MYSLALIIFVVSDKKAFEHFSTAVSLEDFLVFLLEMADYISGASS
jgi:hypothetical protein